MKIKEAQDIVKKFAENNGWKDEPNIDKFDHLHEELLEMSKHLRYKNINDRIAAIKDRHDDFEDGIGDLLFGLLRLANQLEVDVEKAFERTSDGIKKRYNGRQESDGYHG